MQNNNGCTVLASKAQGTNECTAQAIVFLATLKKHQKIPVTPILLDSVLDLGAELYCVVSKGSRKFLSVNDVVNNDLGRIPVKDADGEKGLMQMENNFISGYFNWSFNPSKFPTLRNALGQITLDPITTPTIKPTRKKKIFAAEKTTKFYLFLSSTMVDLEPPQTGSILVGKNFIALDEVQIISDY
jgi:hypothetical protein